MPAWRARHRGPPAVVVSLVLVSTQTARVGLSHRSWPIVGFPRRSDRFFRAGVAIACSPMCWMFIAGLLSTAVPRLCALRGGLVMGHP